MSLKTAVYCKKVAPGYRTNEPVTKEANERVKRGKTLVGRGGHLIHLFLSLFKSINVFFETSVTGKEEVQSSDSNLMRLMFLTIYQLSLSFHVSYLLFENKKLSPSNFFLQFLSKKQSPFLHSPFRNLWKEVRTPL